MTIRYKLTDGNDQTHGNTQWGGGVEHTAPGGDPCTNEVIHWYASPEQAVLFNPIHGAFCDPHLWECDVDETGNDGLKYYGTRCKTLRRVPLPTITTDQRAIFAIRCAKAVYDDPDWNTWADKRLSGTDRTTAAAKAAADAAWTAAVAAWAAEVAAEAAAWAAAEAAGAAAKAAAEAAEAAAWAAGAVKAAGAAEAAKAAADAAAWAAWAAEAAGEPIDFQTIIEKVLFEFSHIESVPDGLLVVYREAENASEQTSNP